MKKILLYLNYILTLTLLSLYSYVLLFSIEKGGIPYNDPKDLELNFIYETIKILYLLSVGITLLSIVAIVFNFFKKWFLFSNTNQKKYILFNTILFWGLYYFDFGNLQSWFFD